MNVKKPATPAITIGDQPDANDIGALKDEGYLAVVNLRNPGEPEQPLSPSAEGDAVRAEGLDYLHLGVGSAPLTEEGVAGFCTFLDEHAAGKTLVHCRRGGRAVALVALYLARARGWTADTFAAEARAAGLAVEGGPARLAEAYLREREASAG